MTFALASLHLSPISVQPLLLCSALLAGACAKPAAPSSAGTATPSNVAAAEPTPEPAQAAAAPPAQEPSPSTTEQPAPTTPITDAERELYDIIMRLARESNAQAELAPKAKLVFHGSREVRQPLRDAHAELAWLADGHVPLVAANEGAAEIEDSSMTCNPRKLRCVVVEPGGETSFKFRRKGTSIQLIEVEGSD